jgi:hypothetical protein
MKKSILFLICIFVCVSLVSCFDGNEPCTEHVDTNSDYVCDKCEAELEKPDEDPFKDLAVMTYEEYAAAELDSPVHIEAYVQATQSWWDNKITVYAADEDGAYFIYELACSEEDAAKLIPGTKIAVKGYKGAWAGEVEIMDATFTFAGEDSYIADPVDLTDLLGTEELIDYQNQLAYFDSLTVVAVEFKNGEPGDDIYVTLSKDGAEYSFCVERYLTGPNTEVYKTVSQLQPGDVVHVEGFLYWYESVNTHITAVYNGGVLSYAEYAAAKLNQHVKIEAYVQATQSWWSDKITVYAADEDGAYFIYELACSEEDAAKLLPGTKILVDGYKGEWAGEVEIMDATFTFAGEETYIAAAKDLTAYLGTDELIDYQNQLASFKGMTVKAIEYKGGQPGDDIYVTLTYGGADYDFCVERYLTGPSSALYQAVQALSVGDTVDVEGFLYWYEGPNTHITNVTVK